MREGIIYLMVAINIYLFIASKLVHLHDLFCFVFWFYLLFRLGKHNLTELDHPILRGYMFIIGCMNIYHNYSPILGEVDNFEIHGITFVVVLLLTDMHTIILDLILFERIQVIIKTLVLVICIFFLVSAYVAYFAFMKFYLEQWIDRGPINLRRNYISCLGDTRTIPYDKMVEMSDHDLSSIRTTYIFDAENHVMSIYSERQFIYKDVKNRPPLVKYAITRYIGEGASLECTFKVNAEILEHVYSIQPFISKDRLDIQNSNRHTIKTLYFNQSEFLVYNIALNIFPLTIEDFNTYRAGIRLFQNSSEKVLSRSAHQLCDEIEEYICVFSVLHIDEYYIYKDVPVGGMLHFRQLFLFAIPNSSNVRVEHIVNGMHFDLIPGITKCCLNSVQAATGNVLTMKLLKRSECSSHKVDIFEIVAAICLCPSLFGIHRIKLVHELYDPEEQQWETLELMHPQITVVYPTTPALQWINISEQERFLIENSKEHKDFSLFNGTLFQYIQNAKRIEFDVMNIIEIILVNLTVTFFMIVMYWSLIVMLYLMKVINRFILTIEMLFQKELEHKGQPIHGSNTENQVSTSATERNMYAYDAFISHVEEDRHFVMHILHPILLQYRLKVFLGDDDLPPGPRIENLETAIKRSKIVLIVVSNDYLTDQLYSYFFPNIVLPSLHDGEISCDKVVLIKYKPCNIPNTWLAHEKIVLYNT